MLTVEQSEKNVIAARTRLQTRAEDTSIRGLSNDLNDIAAAEGRHFVIELVSSLRKQRISDTTIYMRLMDYVLNGPDDTWSGRGNDVRRSYFDGMLGEVRNFGYEISN